MTKLAVLFLPLLFLGACQFQSEELPILGKPRLVDGRQLPHQIPDFRFIDQDSQWVTNATFSGKIYVADFFFTSCPTICPMMTQEMLGIYRQYRDEEHLLLLSHSIDTKRDTVGRLKRYADELGVDSKKWHFVTGDKDELFGIAEAYFTLAFEDPDAPGGFDHSGRLVLVDKNRHIRSSCTIRNKVEVSRFLQDIERLLDEN